MFYGTDILDWIFALYIYIYALSSILHSSLSSLLPIICYFGSNDHVKCDAPTKPKLFIHVMIYDYAAQWGTWKAGVSLINTGIRHPSSVMKNVIPVVMAGVIGIYGLIVAVILAGNIPQPTVGTRVNVYSIYTGMAHLAAGLCCGLSGLAAGGCIGIVGDYGIRSVGYRTSNISVVFSTGDKPHGGGGMDDGDEGGGGSGDENKLFVGMLIMLIFSEALALYGLIVALIVSQHSYPCGGE